MNWTGVLPAITTHFDADGAIDHAAVAQHCRRMIDAGCHGIIACGSLGEAATLSFEEKLEVASTAVKALDKRVPVVLGISALSTRVAVELARGAEKVGCSGLMVLPPYAYSTDWQEMKAHVAAVIAATKLPCMLYNNPAAYKTDFLPEQIVELSHDHPNLHAVKESSGDARRITAIKSLLGERLTVLVGLDDALIEGIAAGAQGWVAGLVNAFPQESVALFRAALQGDRAGAAALYRWFLPLLRLDAVPKFVQFIKWIQAEVGRGTPVVRAPRLALTDAERAQVRALLAHALQNRVLPVQG